MYALENILDTLKANLEAFDVEEKSGSDLTRASVSVVVTPNEAGESSLIMTRRAPRLNAHAGQWALPGGRVDKGETPQQAAQREVEEELGLSLRADRLIGRLDDYETRSGYVMQPFVFWKDRHEPLRPNPAEVSSVHFFQLSAFDRPNMAERLKGPDPDRPILRLNLREGDDPYQINAPTAAILFQFWEVAVNGRATRVAHYDQPRFAWK